MRQFNILKGTKGWLYLYERAVRWAHMRNEDEVRRRAKALDIWRDHGIEAAMAAFEISRATLFRWKQALNEQEGKLVALGTPRAVHRSAHDSDSIPRDSSTGSLRCGRTIPVSARRSSPSFSTSRSHMPVAASLISRSKDSSLITESSHTMPGAERSKNSPYTSGRSSVGNRSRAWSLHCAILCLNYQSGSLICSGLVQDLDKFITSVIYYLQMIPNHKMENNYACILLSPRSGHFIRRGRAGRRFHYYGVRERRL